MHKNIIVIIFILNIYTKVKKREKNTRKIFAFLNKS